MSLEERSSEELVKLLEQVSTNAEKLGLSSFQSEPLQGDIVPASTSCTAAQSKKQEEKVTPTTCREVKPKDLASLPPAIKLAILSHLDPSIQQNSLSISSDKLLPTVQFIPHIKDEKFLVRFTTAELKKLETEGYIIKDSFLGNHEEVVQVLKEAQALNKAGKLKKAGMSKGSEFWSDTKVRGDYILWVSDKAQLLSSSPKLHDLLARMELLKDELNQACNFDCNKTQIQLACYPGGGARYVRHLDSFVGGTNRRLTALYYLNTEWKKEDGGCLRLYFNHMNLPNKTSELMRDIEPISDRLLIFQSRRIEHEVLPTNKERFSLTSWFY